MPVPGRPRGIGGNELRFHRDGQNSFGNTRWRSGPRDRFHAREHVFVERSGYTPGVQDITPHQDLVGAGTIRRLWRQAVNYIAGPAPYSWSENRATGLELRLRGPITRALRYKASSVFRGAGSSNTRFGAPRPIVAARHNQPRVTKSAGDLQGRPTVRQRLGSFGSRVPPVNPKQKP